MILEGLRIRGEGTDEPSWVELDTLAIHYRLLPLLQKRIALGQVRLMGISIDLASGSPGWRFIEQVAQIDSTDQATRPWTFELGMLDLQRLSLKWNEKSLDIEGGLEDVELSLRGETEGYSFDFSCRPRVHSDEGPVLHMTAAGDFQASRVRLNEAQLSFGASRLSTWGRIDLEETTDTFLLEGSMTTNADDLHDLVGSLLPDDLASFQGHLNSSFQVTGSLGSPKIKADLHIDSLCYADLPFLQADLSLDLGLDSLVADIHEFSGLDIRAQGRSSLIFAKDLEHSLELAVYSEDLTPAFQYGAIPATSGGNLKGEWHSSGPLKNLGEARVSAQCDLSRIRFHRSLLPVTRLEVDLEDGLLHGVLREGRNRVALDGRLDSLEILNASLEARLQNIQTLAALTPLSGLSGQLNTRGKLRSTKDGFHWTVDGQGEQLAYQGLQVDSLQLRAHGLDAAWSLESASLVAQEIDLAAIQWSLLDVDLSGNLSCRVDLAGDASGFSGSGRIQGRDLRTGPYRIDTGTIEGIFRDTEIRLSTIRLVRDSIHVDGRGSWDWQRGRIDLDASLGHAGSRDAQLRLTAASQRSGNRITCTWDNLDLGILPELDISAPLLGGISNGAAELLLTDRVERVALNSAIKNFRYQDETIDNLSLAGSFLPGKLAVDSLNLREGDGFLALAGMLPLNPNGWRPDWNKAVDIQASAGELELDFINKLDFIKGKWSGALDGHLDISGSLKNPRVAGAIQARRLSWEHTDLPVVTAPGIQLLFQNQQVQISRGSLEIASVPFKLKATLKSDLNASHHASLQLQAPDGGIIQGSASLNGTSLKGDLEVRRLQLATLEPILPGLDTLGGTLEANILIRGTSSNPSFGGHVEIQDGTVKLGTDLPPLADLHLLADLNEDELELTHCSGRSAGRPFSLTGFIAHEDWEQFTIGQTMIVDGHPAIDLTGWFRKDSLDIQLAAQELDLKLVQPLMRELAELEGTGNSQLRINGPYSTPVFVGHLQLRGVRVHPPILAQPLSGGVISLKSDGKTIHLDTLAFNQGKQGHLSGKGSLQLVHSSLPHIDASLAGDGIKLRDGRRLVGEIDGFNLNWSGKPGSYRLTGKIELQDLTTRQAISPQELVRLAQTDLRPPSEQADLLKQTQVSVRLVPGKGVRLENNLANVRLRPDVQVIGTLASPNLSGRITITDGYLLYLDRRFTLTRGTLDFSDSERMNPIVDLQAEALLKPFQTRSKKAYTIYLGISGTLDKATVELRSEPPLDRTDIIALLTLGVTRSEFAAVHGELDNAALTKLIQSRLEDYTSQRVSAYASQRIGTALRLDEMSIEGNLFEFGQNWGPQLVAAKRLNPRTTVTYTTTVGHSTDQRIKLEYEVTEGLSLEGETDQQGRSGLDLKYGFKFR